MTEVKYNEFSEVVRQGDYSENFYFILKGELECKMGFTIKKKEGNRTKIEKYDPRLVKVYYPGDYFCELNLLYHMPIRGSIKAISDCTLYTLDRKTYKYIINSSYKEKSKNMIELFKKLPIFETLLDEEFEKLPGISKEEIYYKGDIIIKENDYMNTLMIIEEGKCTGYKTMENGKLPKKIRDYMEEDFFGKSALLKEELSEESIIATSDIVKFICFDRRTIKNIFGSFEVILMRDIDVYERYFPPIPEYSEQEPIKDNTKSLVLSFEGENNNQNNNNVLSNKNIDNNNKQIENMIDIGDNQNLPSRNSEKNNIKPEKINSLSYGMEEISKKSSKGKEEMYESEIKRLKEEVSFLKNKLENRSFPELNYNNIKENNKNNYSNIETPEKIMKQGNSEIEINIGDINNKIINKEFNNDKIINNENNMNIDNNINNNINNNDININNDFDNNNLINIEINNKYNINDQSNKENININENMDKNNINSDQNLNIDVETNNKLNNNIIDIEINKSNNEINKSNNEINKSNNEINKSNNEINKLIKVIMK